MKKFRLLVGLTVVFFKSPILSLKKLRWDNVRLLRAALKRHSTNVVLEIVQNNISWDNKLTNISSAHSNSPGFAKAKELEKYYPGITRPVALESIPMLEGKLKAPKYLIDENAPSRVNVLLPQLDPLLMFGGYISCLQFIRSLQKKGLQVRIVLCDSGKFDRAAVERKLASNTALCRAIAAAEVENITLDDTKLVISPSDAFICYSFWTGIKAHHLAQAIGKKFIFFLQEYEAIFHSHDSMHAVSSYVYRLPHRAIFNTKLLADSFKSKNSGVFGQYQGKELANHWVSFQHALTPTVPPTLSELKQRKTKRFLLYGRPEAHASRNMFEIAIIGLRMAIERGYFDEDWEFHGVGTLGPEYDVDLGSGRTLALRGTLPQGSYGAALGKYDIGMSLMLAPHPSILPFEMASAGQIVVTNSFESRTADVLRSISGNIEPCEADPFSVAESLAKAVVRSADLDGRVEGANLDWVRDWDQSFNEEVMAKIIKMVRA